MDINHKIPSSKSTVEKVSSGIKYWNHNLYTFCSPKNTAAWLLAYNILKEKFSPADLLSRTLHWCYHNIRSCLQVYLVKKIRLGVLRHCSVCSFDVTSFIPSSPLTHFLHPAFKQFECILISLECKVSCCVQASCKTSLTIFHLSDSWNILWQPSTYSYCVKSDTWKECTISKGDHQFAPVSRRQIPIVRLMHAIRTLPDVFLLPQISFLGHTCKVSRNIFQKHRGQERYYLHENKLSNAIMTKEPVIAIYIFNLKLSKHCFLLVECSGILMSLWFQLRP